MKTIGVLTSGGDAPGMNAAIRAVVRTGLYNDLRILGIQRGYDGLIKGALDDMDSESVADIVHRGGTVLRTARSEDFMTEEGFKKALNVIDVYNMDGLIVLGGDGTFRGAQKLSDAGIPTIGIPCTIDNDLAYTDYTIGFMTAVETVIEAIGKLRDTSSSHGRANVVEVMGRNCGDIALYAGLAGGAESIIIPEIGYDEDAICRKVLTGKNMGKLHHIIVLAEGVGNSFELAEAIEDKTGVETKVTVLGHVQRGGSPSAFDRILASQMGKRSVELLLQNKSGRVLGTKCNEIIDLEIREALNMKKKLNREMYDTANILSR
ncbi:6-phosphofructokinase [Soehngenia longivitae]|jgi:6-phosphofructokinase (EC 2.7.1.11)|uniref:ATP-dependent 6-phosphofructokinase n=1 Tax=Soehngenia longivitae TaxID=2562294 RepID=A0A4Z0D695_9FIRM|nr:6-phosphofructokinase [Soehngenia longivitae]TFZ40407.1 6-phosphofructokinase [Soehngenia longivitae]